MRALRMVVLGAVAIALVACDKAEETAKTVTPRSTDLGTGINAVERTYPRTATDLVGLTRRVLVGFGLTLKDDVHDALGGTLSAVRADGHTVHAKIMASGKEQSQVSVWVAPGNRDLATLIQQRIAESLSADRDPR